MAWNILTLLGCQQILFQKDFSRQFESSKFGFSQCFRFNNFLKNLLRVLKIRCFLSEVTYYLKGTNAQKNKLKDRVDFQGRIVSCKPMFPSEGHPASWCYPYSRNIELFLIVIKEQHKVLVCCQPILREQCFLELSEAVNNRVFLILTLCSPQIDKEMGCERVKDDTIYLGT